MKPNVINDFNIVMPPQKYDLMYAVWITSLKYLENFYWIDFFDSQAAILLTALLLHFDGAVKTGDHIANTSFLGFPLLVVNDVQHIPLIHSLGVLT